jgi:type VI secretion system protein ImpA
MMAAFDVDALLAPVTPEDPSGPDLEYDRQYGALERMAQGKPEQQMGDTVVPAADPDWKELANQSQSLLERTKDLRIACHLAKALLRTRGLAGFSDGLRLVRGLLEQFWATAYPRLDPEDDDDPTARVNTLAGLADGPTLAALQRVPLVAGSLGHFNLRDFALARGEYPPLAGQTAPEMALIDAAFEAANLPEIEATLAAATRARDDVAAIEALITDQVGASRTINFGRLATLLNQAVGYVGTRVEQRRPIVEEPMGEGNGVETGGGDGNGASPQGGRMPGQIRSRDDVVRALDQIAAYYERHEPSSPVPLLVKRAKRLAKMSFMDIVKDMAPDAMSQVELIGGSKGDEEAK